MPNNIKLKISRHPKNGNGWTNVFASNGEVFAYKYTGGNSGNNNGNQEYDADGQPEVFNLICKCDDDQDYEFLAFRNKSASADLAGNILTNGETVQITDDCKLRGTFSYGVQVGVRNANPAVTFECDPRIYNR